MEEKRKRVGEELRWWMKVKKVVIQIQQLTSSQTSPKQKNLKKLQLIREIRPRSLKQLKRRQMNLKNSLKLLKSSSQKNQ